MNRVLGILMGFVSLLSFTTSSMSLDRTSVIPPDQNKVIKAIVKSLEIDKHPGVDIISLKLTLHKELKPWFEEEWYAFWFNNKTLKKSKYVDEEVRFLSLVLINNNRHVSFFFIFYPRMKQIAVTRIESVVGTSEAAISVFDKHKATGKYVKDKETDNYAVLGDKVLAAYNIYRVHGEAGQVTYVDHYVIDVPFFKKPAKEYGL